MPVVVMCPMITYHLPILIKQSIIKFEYAKLSKLKHSLLHWLQQLHISDLHIKMPTATLLLSPVVGRRTSYQEVVHRCDY